ncbi:MAG: hypothetical protein M1829_005565 [Trizodia sp. TS-e1964]|nr:MAG: hypothetical protein M1829_005565 [Trizodia sp. TS-e1964]
MAFSRKLTQVRLLNQNNLRALRKAPLAEISGAFGDLGTLLPILIALTLSRSISISSTLVFTGLANIITGLLFGIPLPVQPMKAIAAIAIANSFSTETTAAAGIFVASVVLFMSLTGLIRWFSKVIPIPIVKGIQVGAGLSLVLTAGSKFLQPLKWNRPSWCDNLFWALGAFILLVFTAQYRRFPYALLVLILGVTISFIQLVEPMTTRLPALHFWNPHIIVPSPKDFQRGAIEAGIGQLPLTTLNSIFAVAHLCMDLFPELPAPSDTELGVSVALMNLVGCWFGAMPVCHGSGGLAAQYRFGARSGASIILLGILKLTLGLFVGESLVSLLMAFPQALLGILVLAAGLELAKAGESLNNGARDLWEEAEEDASNAFAPPSLIRKARPKLRELSDTERIQRWTVMLMTVGGLLAFKNDAVGFLAGLICHLSFVASREAGLFHQITTQVGGTARSIRVWARRSRLRGAGALSRHGEDEGLLQNGE